MRTILFPILSTILSLTTLLAVDRVSAQTPTTHCQTLANNYDAKSNICQSNSHTLTEESWHRLMAKYYRTRQRTQFQVDNDLLSLQEVNSLLGFSGTRNNIEKGSSHQYLSWQDTQNPHKKIEAVFVYHRLVGLRSKGFKPFDFSSLNSHQSAMDNH